MNLHEFWIKNETARSSALKVPRAPRPSNELEGRLLMKERRDEDNLAKLSGLRLSYEHCRRHGWDNWDDWEI